MRHISRVFKRADTDRNVVALATIASERSLTEAELDKIAGGGADWPPPPRQN
jgi:hypothetical protein